MRMDKSSLRISVEYNWSIYHLLCCAFGQCVPIFEVVDLDVLDVVAIRDVHVTVDVASA